MVKIFLLGGCENEKVNEIERRFKMTISILGYHLAVVFYKCGWHIFYKYTNCFNEKDGFIKRKKGEPIFISLGRLKIRFYPRIRK